MMVARLPIKVVLFDLGSTLIYFDADWAEVIPASHEVLLSVLKNAGILVDQERFLAEFDRRLREYFRERDTEFIEHTTQYLLRSLLQDLGHLLPADEVLRQALAAMYAISQSHWQTEPDAVPVLETLRGQGYRLGIISNAGDDADVQALIDNAGIRQYFEYIITSAAAGIRKPNPRIFHDALAFFAARPDEAVMVGDTLGADILGARNAGIRSVWITRRADTPDNRDHLDTIVPDGMIGTLDALPALLASWQVAG